MKNRTTNQLGLAPMRIPNTRASWIEPAPTATSSHGRPATRAGRGPDAQLWLTIGQSTMKPDAPNGPPLGAVTAPLRARSSTAATSGWRVGAMPGPPAAGGRAPGGQGAEAPFPYGMERPGLGVHAAKFRGVEASSSAEFRPWRCGS